MSLPRNDERGSMPLALLAVLIISGLVAVLMSTSVAAQRQARHDRDFTTVLFAADAAVEQAKFRLQASTEGGVRLPEPESTASDVRESCPLLGVSWCIVGGSPEQGTFEWYAQRIGVTRGWEIFTAGERNGVTRRLRVVIEEDRRFFAAAFAQRVADFQNQNIAQSYNSGRTGAMRWAGPGRTGIVGSNGRVRLGGSTVVDGVQLWNIPAGENALSTTRCDGSQAIIGLAPTQFICSTWAQVNPGGAAPYLERFAAPKPWAPSGADLTAATAACGAGPYPSLTLSASGVTVSGIQVRSLPVLRPYTGPGDPLLHSSFRGKPRIGVPGQEDFVPGHYCFSDVAFDADSFVIGSTEPMPTSTAAITPAMADPDDPVILYVTGEVRFVAGAKVNCIGCPTAPPATSPAPPRAAALQVYLPPLAANPTAVTRRFGLRNETMYGGTIYGPTADCGLIQGAAAKGEIYGAMICDTISGVGQWKFNYDESLDFIGNGVFQALRWDER